MYGKFKSNKIKSSEDNKQAKLDRVNQMKKIYLQPRQGIMKTAGKCSYLFHFINEVSCKGFQHIVFIQYYLPPPPPPKKKIFLGFL